ncbi:hypothetical protein GCM10027275_12540 [Rhabdobacter roseus]|uniref:Uncharacterized protein n=1 Tax=Rhabdobacter roseus TaxID=1655419 RepID=A0A840TT37_9BACT|nr:hypothetical protein [Rhabdobacter roseus]MBB5283170.1 hypothetical protein [Rhabdobacter roseus]
MLAVNAEDRQRIALSWAMSIGITLLVLTTFYFIRLSRSTPQAVPMELFLEVNYGVDKVGSGNIQTFNKANDSKVAENMRRDDEPREQKAVTPPRTVPTPPTPRPEPTKPTTRATEKVIASRVESPVEEAEKPEPKKVTSASTPATAPVAKAEPEKKINNDALFKKSSGSSSGSNGTSGTKSGVGGNNNGDDASGVGDKGAKDGSLYSKNYNGGGGGGGTNVGLNLNGWGWSRPPVVNDKSDATGDITFKIFVDRNGRVKNVITQSTTVTDYSVVNQYKNAVRALTFIAKSANVPDESEGTITFKIRAN